MKYILFMLSCILMSSAASAGSSNAQQTTRLEPNLTIIDTAPVTPSKPTVSDLQVTDTLVASGGTTQISAESAAALKRNLCSSITCANGQTCVDGCCKFQ